MRTIQVDFFKGFAQQYKGNTCIRIDLEYARDHFTQGPALKPAHRPIGQVGDKVYLAF